MNVYSPRRLRRALRTGTPDGAFRRFLRWLWNGAPLCVLTLALSACTAPRDAPAWRTDYRAWSTEPVTLTLPRAHLATLLGYTAEHRLPAFATYIRWSGGVASDDSARAVAHHVTRALRRAVLQ